MKATLLIPCVNFEHSLPATLEALRRWHLDSGREFQVCMIDDGSSDGTGRLLDRFAADHRGWFRSVRLPSNQGKGAAIKKGFQLVAGETEYICFTDCDLHYGLTIFSEVFLPLLQTADIVIADRSWVASSNPQSLLRRSASFTFNRLMATLTGVTFRDSQAGCKGFRASTCGPIFDLLTTDGFAFDVELLSIASYYRLRIAQVAVRFRRPREAARESSIQLGRSSMAMVADLIRINLRWKRGRYAHRVLEQRIDDHVYTIDNQEG
jgi:dolichyl-phosphate beta-glucosyltransferase